MNKVAIMILGMFTAILPSAAFAADSKTDEFIDKASEQLKEALKKCGDKIDETQKYLQEYDWKGLIPKPHSGAASITDATFNGKRVACVVKPGERIEGEVAVTLDPEAIKDMKYHRLVIGFNGIGAQTSFGVGAGVGYLVTDTAHNEKFTLIAPKEPGLYQVRFRPVAKTTDAEALTMWKDEQGNAPSASSTIGFIWVKE